MKKQKIDVQGKEIAIITREQKDYISLTDIAKYKNRDAPADIVKNWMRSRSTIDFLGLWEKLNNPDFKLVEFDQFRNEAGANYFVLSPLKWIETTNATGIISRSGKNGRQPLYRTLCMLSTLYIVGKYDQWAGAEAAA